MNILIPEKGQCYELLSDWKVNITAHIDNLIFADKVGQLHIPSGKSYGHVVQDLSQQQGLVKSGIYVFPNIDITIEKGAVFYIETLKITKLSKNENIKCYLRFFVGKKKPVLEVKLAQMNSGLNVKPV